MLPNFMIVGAAKAGTTSLFEYLGAHPKIFTPTKKEPKFFTSNCYRSPLSGPGDNHVELQITRSIDDYRRLFEGSESFPLRGEASPDSLYYWAQAIPEIKSVLGDVKIIIMLRNPVNRAFSNYMHLVRDGRELLSFEDALALEESRIAQNYEFFWHYRSCGKYNDAVAAFKGEFSRVKTVIFEEWAKNIVSEMRDVYEFLGVEPIVNELGEIYNESGVPKSRFLQKALHPTGLTRKVIRNVLEVTHSYAMARTFRSRLRSLNLDKTKKIKSDTYDDLMKFYIDDINRLEVTLGRSLNLWMQKK